MRRQVDPVRCLPHAPDVKAVDDAVLAQVYLYTDPVYGQDVYHLDDWFWDVGINQIVDLATNVFLREFCVVDLVNPNIPDDIYPLAQLRGLDGSLWPPGTPNNPACQLLP